jgi:tRNA dimethylallyltransferase
VALVPNRLVGIVGPTASGKSALALELARECGGEIVSCDSLQVYRGLDIGSAKPTALERTLVPHHLVDVAEPDGAFSAAEYARLARAVIEDIARRGRLPILAGGTGLYLRALLEGLFPGPARDETLRARLESIAQVRGCERLHRMLNRVDPDAAQRISIRDQVRVIRALEVYFLTGKPLSQQQGHAEQALLGHDTLLVGLAPSRAELARRVERRTEAMLAAGLIDETRALMARGLASARPLGAIGYRQAVAVIEGRLALEAARAEITRDTMRYAKRQMTWFRHQAQVAWFADAPAAHEAVVQWLAGRGDPRGLTGPTASA